MAENKPFSIADSIREARERVALELRAQADQIQKLTRELTELQQLHERTGQEISRAWDEVTRAAELAAEESLLSSRMALENVLGAVRGLMTCMIPEQVFATLTEEAAQLGVRAAIFDVRGKAAWGASAHGFSPALSENVLRTLIIPLNQDTPFRTVCETAGHVEATAETLKRNRNLLDKLKPAPHSQILLLPIRSAGTVAAIFYADSGDEDAPLPADALKILTEFAGAQIDRLIALSGGFPAEVEEEAGEAGEKQAHHEESAVAVAEEAPAPSVPSGAELGHAESQAAEPVMVEPAAGRADVEMHHEVVVAELPLPKHEPSAPDPDETLTLSTPFAEMALQPPPAPEKAVEPPASFSEMVLESAHPSAEEAVETHAAFSEMVLEPPPQPAEMDVEPLEVATTVVVSEHAATAIEPPVEDFSPRGLVETPPPQDVEISAPPEPAAPVRFDEVPLSEADQKMHKDARRFAKLLVSEIELYNKAKVAEGRKNRDLYKRLKTDIDRSRQTFEKRFGKALSRQVDYFHDELVKTLAENDPTVLGSDYPGPSA